jgi:hypothetical protein
MCFIRGADLLVKREPKMRNSRARILGLASTCPILSMAARVRRSAIETKALLREGRALCRYILRGPIPGGVLRRYVRAVRAVDQQAQDQAAGPLALPRLALAAPSWLRVYEPLRRDAPLAQRLRLATALVEWAPGGTPMRTGSMTAFVMLWQVMLDVAVLPLRWWLGR